MTKIERPVRPLSCCSCPSVSPNAVVFSFTKEVSWLSVSQTKSCAGDGGTHEVLLSLPPRLWKAQVCQETQLQYWHKVMLLAITAAMELQLLQGCQHAEGVCCCGITRPPSHQACEVTKGSEVLEEGQMAASI